MFIFMIVYKPKRKAVIKMNEKPKYVVISLCNNPSHTPDNELSKYTIRCIKRKKYHLNIPAHLQERKYWPIPPIPTTYTSEEQLTKLMKNNPDIASLIRRGIIQIQTIETITTQEICGLLIDKDTVKELITGKIIKRGHPKSGYLAFEDYYYYYDETKIINNLARLTIADRRRYEKQINYIEILSQSQSLTPKRRKK